MSLEKEQFNALVDKVSEAAGVKIDETVKNALKGLVTAEEIKGLATSADLETLKQLAEEAKEAANQALEAKNNSKVKTFAEEIAENREELKSILTGASNKEIVFKANATRASVADSAHAYDLPEIGQLAHAKLSAYDVFPKINVSGSNDGGVIRYVDWDDATKVRAAAAVAEGAAFPESTAAWVTKTISLQKIGDTLPISEELIEDEAMLAAEVDMFVDTNVKIECNNQVVNGDGTGNNLLGAFASAPAYTASASGITDASIYDLIPKVVEAIVTTGGAKYNPDIVLMNRADINKYKLKKDANNNYVMPPFVNREGSVIDGVTVIEDNAVAANTLIVGDRRYGRIYEKGGVGISRGMVNAQFSEDMLTVKARKRLAFLIREADKGGFRKVTSISAALTTLAT